MLVCFGRLTPLSRGPRVSPTIKRLAACGPFYIFYIHTQTTQHCSAETARRVETPPKEHTTNGPIGRMAAPRPPHLVASAKRWLRRAKGSEKKEEKTTRARRGASASAAAATAAS